MNDLWQDIDNAFHDLQEELKEGEELGIKWSNAENAYQAAKHKRTLELKADGHTATMIQMLLKGDSEVATKLFERDSALVLYNASKSRENALKLKIRVLDAQLQREWGAR